MRLSTFSAISSLVLCEALTTDASASTETPASPTPTKRPKSEAVPVTLEDGRVVEFVGKRKLLKESLVPGEADYTGPLAVRLDFRNGRTITFPIPDALSARFAAHGAEQKLGDATAGEDEPDDMVLAVEDLIERLNKNEWSAAREAGGMSGTSVLLQALVEFSGKTVETIKTFLKDKSQKDKMALRQSPQLKPIVDRIEAEKAAKDSNVDAGALLAGLAAS